MNDWTTSPLGWSQYCQTPVPLSPPSTDQWVSATCAPSGKVVAVLQVVDVPGHRDELVVVVVGLGGERVGVGRELVGHVLDGLQRVGVVGDGLVVPERGVAVLGVVHEPLERQPVVGGLELAAEVGLGPPVRTERRRRVRVVDRGALGLVGARLVGRLGDDVGAAGLALAHPDVGQVDRRQLLVALAVLVELPPGGPTDDQGDHDADDHDHERPATLRALGLPAHALHALPALVALGVLVLLRHDVLGSSGPGVRAESTDGA